MNTQILGELVKLRYKLMWAKTRTRNGRIALFFCGYILLVMVISVLAGGGFGAGIIAIQSGKAFVLAAAVLGGMFLQAVLASVLLGFGMNQVFSDAEMRRYPLSAGERLLIRHLVGILDPFWYLILALEFGLAFGLFAYGAGSFWMGLFAVLLLFVSNYLFARVLAQMVERLVSKKGGSTLLLACIMAIGFIPGILGPQMKKNPQAFRPVVEVLRYTPPAAAAQAMTHWNATAIAGLGVLCVWIAGLIAALTALERRPIKMQAAQGGKVSWASPFERIGGFFGPELGILVAQWLRFYSRNNRFRMIYPLAVPISAFLVIAFPRQVPEASRFLVGLGAFTIVGFFGTLQFAVNLFGYTGGGFRRYLLLPMNPGAVFRAGSYTFLLLGSVLLPVATVVLLLFPPVPMDWHGYLMFVCAAVAAMFVMNGIAVWVTLLSPRRGNFNASFGNDLSVGGNVVVIGSIMLLMFLPRLLARLLPDIVWPSYWWVTVLLAALAVPFYFASLRAAERSFVQRRESLLAIMEGRA